MRISLIRNSQNMQSLPNMDNELFDYLFSNGIPFNIVEDGINETVFEFETEEDVKQVKKQLTLLKLMYS